MSNFTEGQQVRLNQSAFGNSTEPQDVALRGQVVELVEELGMVNGETLWCAFAPSIKSEVYLIESELEKVPA